MAQPAEHRADEDSAAPQPEPPAAPAAPPIHIRALPEAMGADAPARREGGEFFGIRPNELRRTLTLAGYLFVASCVFVLGRTVRDALFLSHYQNRVGSLLPFMFIAYGAASAPVAVFYARFASRVRRDRLVIGASLVFAATYVLARALVPVNPPWLFGALYVWAEIVGNLTVTQFWSVANALHDPRSAKRLFGVIGAGRVVGMVLCGLGTGSVVEQIGTENLLFVLAALLVVIAGFAVVLSREHGLSGEAPPRAGAQAALPALMRSGYVRGLALLLLVGFVVVNIGDFQFKAAARMVHPGRDELAHFMALFYATLGAAALVLQLAGTRWLLGRFGVTGGMLALPVAYVLANVAFALFPSLQTVTVLKLSDNAFQYTIFEATLQLLYFPLPSETRDGVRSFLEAVAKPLGYALAGVAVLALRFWRMPDSIPAVAAQSWFVVPLGLFWIGLVPRVRARYLTALEGSLSRRYADPGGATVNDATTRAVLVRTITGPAPRPAAYAFEQLLALDPGEARAQLSTVLASQHAGVRAAAAEAAGKLGAADEMPRLRELLDDPDDAVAAAAAGAYGELAGEDCLPVLADHVHTRRPRVQDAVLASLLRRGGLEGVLAAGRVVEAWLGSSEASERARAAALFAHPGIPGLVRIVRRLLADQDPAVRHAALAAAGAVGDPAACEAILGAMADRGSEGAAARALARIGDAAVPAVSAALGNEKTPRSVRLTLPRVLAQIRTRASYDALLAHVDARDEWVRQKVLASASRARAAGGFPPMPARDATRRMTREIDAVAAMREQYAPSRAYFAIPLLDRFVIERLRKGLIRVLRLGELAHPHAQVAAARDALFAPDPARRARAVEILENLLDVNVRRRFVAELDALIELRATPLPRPGPGRGGEDALVRQLVALPEPFARVIGLDAAQFRNVRLPDETMVSLTRDEDPVVRELAALNVATFKPAGWRDVLDGMRADPDARVTAYACYAFETGRTGMEPTDEMYTTLEKVLFLQRIALFADVPPEHLVALARSAEVERRAAGAVVFRQGDPGDALYFVIDGKVRVTSEGRPAHDLGEGEVFGEMSVLDSAPRTAMVEVVDDATLMRIAQEDFYDVLHGTAELAEGVIHVLVRRLRAAAASG